MDGKSPTVCKPTNLQSACDRLDKLLFKFDSGTRFQLNDKIGPLFTTKKDDLIAMLLLIDNDPQFKEQLAFDIREKEDKEEFIEIIKMFAQEQIDRQNKPDNKKKK